MSTAARRGAALLAAASALLLSLPAAPAADFDPFAPIAGTGAPAGTPAPAPPAAGPSFLEFDLYAGSTLGSSTRVGENADHGTTLRLKDLGVRWEEQLHVTLGRWLGRDDRIAFSLVDTILEGSATLPSDIHYNGATLEGGTTISSHPLFVTLEARYLRILERWGPEGRGTLGLDMGIRLDYLHWYFGGTLDPATTGHEKGEGFDKQATPIPVVGLDLREPLSRGLDFVAGVRGFRANEWPTLRNEGGAVSLSETYLEARAGLEWALSRSTRLAVQARYELVDIREHSHEDRNAITLETLGVMASLTVDF